MVCARGDSGNKNSRTASAQIMDKQRRHTGGPFPQLLQGGPGLEQPGGGGERHILCGVCSTLSAEGIHRGVGKPLA